MVGAAVAQAYRDKQGHRARRRVERAQQPEGKQKNKQMNKQMSKLSESCAAGRRPAIMDTGIHA